MAKRSSSIGRPLNSDGRNRDMILSSAREIFAQKGFEGTTLRAIALAAGVDVALVAHYFGSKAELFAETMEVPEVALSLLLDSLGAHGVNQGEQLTRAYLALWEQPATSAQMRVLGRSALTNEAAAEKIRAVFSSATGDPRVAAMLQGRERGFMLAMSHLLGVAIARYLIKVPLLADEEFESIVEAVAPSIDSYLT